MQAVSENTQVILSVLDNMQRILNTRAGSLKHLPDYGLPDMTKILRGMPGTAHQLIGTLSQVLLKYEPRLKGIQVTMQEQEAPGHLRYSIDAELHDLGVVRYGTDFTPEGRVLIRHLKGRVGLILEFINMDKTESVRAAIRVLSQSLGCCGMKSTS